MKAAAFEYVRPARIEDATKALAEADGAAMPISGGQSLLVLMGLRMTMIETLVDISRLDELRDCHEADDHFFIGSCTTHAKIEDNDFPDPSHGLMPRVASKIAYRAVRNMGTIGGSMALADPSADWPACLIALGAEVRIVGPNGPRSEVAEKFVTGAYETCLDTGEIVVGFEVPKRAQLRWGTHKVNRKSGAFADSMAVAIDSADRNECRVAFTGTTSHARLLPGVSAYMATHEKVDVMELREIILRDVENVAPEADAYQRRCHVATISRAIAEARTS